ncbi:hypothetical protein BD289DRAFT_446177 [Coniella lustricola]|uniref:Uncharacterized protein n=1 Tax=Coniella lustricola TaxID=2025994 RepID=A0A2T2ZU72_9PEZI|nr:hypothetical protein BD289DRAFT_446177 [Coniella lustricola]
MAAQATWCGVVWYGPVWCRVFENGKTKYSIHILSRGQEKGKKKNGETSECYTACTRKSKSVSFRLRLSATNDRCGSIFAAMSPSLLCGHVAFLWVRCGGARFLSPGIFL